MIVPKSSRNRFADTGPADAGAHVTITLVRPSSPARVRPRSPSAPPTAPPLDTRRSPPPRRLSRAPGRGSTPPSRPPRAGRSPHPPPARPGCWCSSPPTFFSAKTTRAAARPKPFLRPDPRTAPTSPTPARPASSPGRCGVRGGRTVRRQNGDRLRTGDFLAPIRRRVGRAAARSRARRERLAHRRDHLRPAGIARQRFRIRAAANDDLPFFTRPTRPAWQRHAARRRGNPTGPGLAPTRPCPRRPRLSAASSAPRRSQSRPRGTAPARFHFPRAGCCRH